MGCAKFFLLPLGSPMVDGGANRFGVARRNRSKLGAGIEVNRLIRNVSVRLVPNAVAILVPPEERVKHPTVEVIFERRPDRPEHISRRTRRFFAKTRRCVTESNRAVAILPFENGEIVGVVPTLCPKMICERAKTVDIRR